jgi:hypothetical protein
VAEAVAGNMAVHIVYCVRATGPVVRADPFAPGDVPVCREMTGEDLVRGIRPDGTMSVSFDGLRIPVALPPLASAILPLIDGVRSVAEIGEILSQRGTRTDAFGKAWRQTFIALERINRVLLAAPRSAHRGS